MNNPSHYDHEKAKPVKSHHDLVEDAIQQQVDSIISEEALPPSALITPAMRRAKVEQQVREAISFPEFEQYIASAVEQLCQEGAKYLDEDENAKVLKSLKSIQQGLGSLNLSELTPAALQEAVKMPADCADLIFKMGVTKYTQGSEDQLDECLAIYYFLTLVRPEDPEYWYRLGLTAHRSENYPLALRAFAATTELTPEFVDAYIYSAFCHLKMGSKEEEQAALAKAKAIQKTSSIGEKWQQHVHEMEGLLALSE